jgi:acetyl-CoA carboxylase biotin carboxyl carrier protein
VRFGGRRPPPPPDPDLIRALARLLDETGLGEIEYAVGRHRLRVARTAAAVAAPPPTIAAAPGTAPETAPGAAPEAMIANHPGALTAPMVGTIYLAPEPGATPFVRVGDTVVTGQTLLIIEAMKVMNEIRCTRPGRVVRILVADGQPIEYGAVLMLIE